MTGFRRLVAEVHRRSLWQVMGIYVGGSWIALEVAGELTENFGLPEWFPAFALALLVIGLPVVLATAFVQEGPPRALTPEVGQASAPAVSGEGPGRPDAAPANGAAASLFTWRNAILGGVVAFGIWGVVATAWLLVGPGGMAARGDVTTERPSIAVLPFDNLSGDEENAYFADGVHEEILTRLAGIPALRVISRTSVMEYRDREKNLREIARELGVNSILEGSVRRAGDQVRITAQLIDAQTDEHLWAQSYDRSMSDIFAIQADVAEQIAAALHAELGDADRRELATRPTNDLAAYEDFLRAREMENRGRRRETLAASQHLYERAIERDPSFVDARARLAWSHLLTYWLGFDRSPERVERARAQIEQLRAIAPDAAATHYALGFLRYYGEYDFAGAAAEFEKALDDLPYDARAGLAYAQRRLGRWEDHIRNLVIARELSPRDQDVPRNLAETYGVLGRYEEAAETYRAAIELSPTSTDAYVGFVSLHRNAGRLDRSEAVLDEAAALELTDPELTEGSVRLAAWRGDHPAALALTDGFTQDFLITQLQYTPIALIRADLLTAAGQSAAAGQAYAQAHRLLETAAAERPWDPRVWLALAHTRAGLRRAEAAHQAMARVRELYPVERDHILGPDILVGFAQVHARLGEQDEALDILERVLARPSRLTAHALRLDPVWQPLRSNPRFQSLLRM
ncbi:MAG TPA: tetratricopeptide repeat protein [Longimicrobiales bacterium]|nr:tetratricopeptide repeat protein [Longimicrobiales bacterium]